MATAVTLRALFGIGNLKARASILMKKRLDYHPYSTFYGDYDGCDIFFVSTVHTAVAYVRDEVGDTCAYRRRLSRKNESRLLDDSNSD